MTMMELYEAYLLISLEYWAAMSVICGTSVWALSKGPRG